jgi:putative nucleotidyltransferase with HDIG domain
LLLAEEMELSAADHHALRVGAPLHDIGKIGIDDCILRKRGRLTPAEFEQMKSHTVKGATILETIPEFAFIIPIVRNHHERWDGKGYPDGLADVNIPRLARLVAVADTFDALTTNRPYRAGMPLRHAFTQIEQAAGTQLDPECAMAFLELRPQLEELLQQHGACPETATMLQLKEMRQLAGAAVLA